MSSIKARNAVLNHEHITEQEKSEFIDVLNQMESKIEVHQPEE